MIFRSPYPDLVIPDVTLPELLFANSADYADNLAFINGLTGQTMTYAELTSAIDKVAAALAERGVGKGDVVGIFSPNSPYYAVAFHGVLRAGATATTINALYTAEEVAQQLLDSGASLLFTVTALLERADVACRRTGISTLIVLDSEQNESSLAALLATKAAAPRPVLNPESDVAVLPYSSGTTGRPKGVQLTHRNLVANLVQFDQLTQMDAGIRILAVLPFFHIYGMQVVMNHPLHVRGTVVTMPRFDLSEFLRIIAEYEVNRVYIAPPIAVALAKHPMVDQYDLSTLDMVFSGAAPLDENLAEAVHNRLGCRVRQGYGMTEMSPVSHAIPDARSDVSIGTVGVILPNMLNKIVDPATGQELGPGERGELWCKGPNVMKGYLNDTDATDATLDAEGFLHTGDVAVIDDSGLVTIVDRVKELIKYKGYQVPPAELEALLLTHPLIADCAVIGIRSAEGEEVPKAFIVRQQGNEELTAEMVVDFVAERVAPHKKIRAVEFLEAIPKSSSGKILRKELRALV